MPLRSCCPRGLRLFVLTTLCLLAVPASAQLLMTNPGEILELEVGNAEINKYVDQQTTDELATAVEQNTMSAMFTQMHSWQNTYNAYLKTVDGFASSIKAASHIYNDGVKILLTIYDIYAATQLNPQGVVASVSLSPIFFDTIAEAISVFTLLKDAIATGGSENMLTGSERSKTLWAINDKLTTFYKDLSRLSLSIRYYQLTDVWRDITFGHIDHNNGELAVSAHSRWKRAAATINIR